VGDRANFGLKQNDGNTIYVYGHWAGENMLARFANAIQSATDAGRLPGDEAYANRIIISQIIGEDWANPLSWGITVNYIADNEHRIPIYDHSTDTISLYDYSWEDGLGDVIVTFSREQFIRKYSKSLMEV
jgi:hypothetical protein